MISNELRRRAGVYIKMRRAQELDHTDPALDDARTETHDAFMIQLDIDGIKYTDREHAAQIALAIVTGEEETMLQPEPSYKLVKDLLTTKQAAEVLEVSLRRIQAMVKQSCPVCRSERTNCPRCRGTGHKLPHREASIRSGMGAIKLIYPWALDLPDVRSRWHGQGGRPIGLPESVDIQLEGNRYIVLVDGKAVGRVYRKGEARRSWLWESGETISEEYYRNRKDAIAVLLSRTYGFLSLSSLSL